MRLAKVRAAEVEIGDRLVEDGKPSEKVAGTETFLRTLEGMSVKGVEVWVESDPLGMPALTVLASDWIEVYR